MTDVNAGKYNVYQQTTPFTKKTVKHVIKNMFNGLKWSIGIKSNKPGIYVNDGYITIIDDIDNVLRHSDYVFKALGRDKSLSMFNEVNKKTFDFYNYFRFTPSIN